jgi:ADP-ribose pyrophosphatase YjhB (NUDIX family)
LTRRPVTASLLHDLVGGSHAEGTTRLAVAALIEDGDRILLIEVDDTADAVDSSWEPPIDLVLPGETLTDAVCRAAARAGIGIDHVTGYLGHHDVLTGDDVLRTFVFAATTEDPGRIGRRTLSHPHQWAATDDLPEDVNDDILRFIHLATPAVNADNPDRSQPLPAALRAHARGLLADEAAADLLIGSSWLRRNDFVDDYVETAAGLSNGTPMASVDWPAAITALETGALPCSGGEGRMLRIAASLAEGIPIDLRDALTGLDIDNLDLVTEAVLHTGGQ